MTTRQMIKNAKKIVKNAKAEHLELVRECEKEHCKEVHRRFQCMSENKEYVSRSAEIDRDFRCVAFEEFNMTEEEFNTLHEAVRILDTFVGACAVS